MELTPAETRVLGCLLEKERTTPESYPLTLNSLVNACNQLTNREPVMTLGEREIENALDGLRQKKLATVIFGAGSRVQKYRHIVPDMYNFSPQESALLCVLLLRGPQTAAELRSRAERMAPFDTLTDAENALHGLEEGSEPLVRLLPARPGQKERRYVQLLSGEPSLEVQEVTAPPRAAGPVERPAEESGRIEALESEVAALRGQLARLEESFADLRAQLGGRNPGRQRSCRSLREVGIALRATPKLSATHVVIQGRQSTGSRQPEGLGVGRSHPYLAFTTPLARRISLGGRLAKSGVCLHLPGLKNPAKKSPILRVFGYVRRYPLLASGMLLCAIGGTLTVIVFPKVTESVTNVIQSGQHRERLLPLVLLALGAFFVQELLNSLRILLNNVFEQKVIFDLRSDLYAHIQRLPLGWFDNRSTGDLMTRILEDVTAVERVLIDGIEQGIIAVLQIVVVVVMLVHFNPGLTLAALSTLPFLIAGALLYTLTAHGRYKQQRAAASAMNSLLHDNLAGIRQIKTYVREDEEHRRFNSVSDRLREASLVIMRTWAVYNPTMNFFTSAGRAVVLLYGGWAVLDGTLQLSGFVAVLTLVGFLYEPIRQLHSLNQLVQSGRAAGGRVFEIMDTPPEAADESPALDPGVEVGITGDVRFANVSFSYDEERPVLKNITLHAASGQTVALVGPTGAGKSTLVNLITRFYEFEQGEIEIDHRPLKDIPRSQLREAVGLVTQESFLFNGTVRDNLRLGRPDATDDQLLLAAEAANARGFIDRMPKGLDTVVGERGVKLSVGEKQRVSIARALLKDPPILILDEATASVDTQTERAIQQALDHLMRGRTSFVIAHRLSTVRRADQILVMEHGRIIERGRHAELLAAGGLYAKLCESAFLDGEDEKQNGGEPDGSPAENRVLAAS